MKTAKEIAQWVIDNRYPKNEKDKVSDLEMYHELVESIEKLSNIPAVNVSVVEQIRQAFADYRRAEGCSCCRDTDAHKEAENRLAELLKPIPYDCGDGFDW